MDATKLVAWLRFDESTTLDRCGGTWTAYGSPTIENGALKLDGSSCLKLSGGLELGGQDFTIHGWAQLDSSTAQVWGGLFALNGNRLRIIRYNDLNNAFEIGYKGGLARLNVSPNLTTRFHFELDYQHSTGKWFTFFNGTLIHTYTNSLTRTTYANVFVGGNGDNASTGGNKWGGTIDEFMIYDGVALHTSDFTPPTAAEYEELAFQLDSHVSFTVDVERVVQNDAYIKRIAQSLKVWLPFDESATADKCGNEWTAYGSPTISTTNAISGKALQLDGSGQYLDRNESCELGGTDFTIHYYQNKTGGASRATPFNIYYDESHFMLLSGEGWYINYTRTNSMPSGFCHIEFDYVHSEQKVYFFVNGTLINSRSTNIFVTRLPYTVRIGTASWGSEGRRDYFGGAIDEFMIFDGVALHTANFTPPTAADYEALAFQLDSHVSFTVDVERRISNRVEFTADVERKVINAWRYVNLGTADSLTVTGTTLTDLPETKSVTGTAFYQTAGAKCFDLPTTAEIWIKFDVYFDGSARWRAYNGGANGATGITAQTNNEITYFTNGGNNVHAATNTAKKNQLQTVLLHMISGSSAGVIEAWVDGTKIYTYTGDVNHGEDFADIYLQSDGAGTFFSNVIISNKDLTFADGYQKFTADVERRISNRVEFTVPVERVLIEPLIVPFLIGDHFNHLIQNIYISPDTPEKIVLPKTSKVYLHADGINGGAVKIYSDTDDTGTVTGDVYAALDDCRNVYIKSVVAPQTILNRFMYRLKNKGASGLDEAINDCTGGLFTSKADVINSFLNDLDNGSGFLKNCCGVILDNEDTGAAIGSDAGGGYPKNAEMVVPELVPVEDWVVPEKGSSKKIEGLTVNFPTSGRKGTFTAAEKHILAGLNSVWLEQALLLIRKSCGLTFRDAATGVFSTRTLNVKFVDEQKNTLAYVAAKYRDGRAYELSLCVNMYIYEIIDKTSVDGAAHSHVHLDRTLAHEMTHAVMAACIHDFADLPLFIKEGSAELIHGIDDEDTIRIRYLIQTDLRSRLESIFTTGGDSGDIYVYVAGYLFFRYLIKQTIERGNVRTPSATVTNLFISDGEVDYYGRALTDNTRATLTADTLRELVKTSSFAADVEIFDTIPIEFLADINRAIKGKVKLFTVDNSEYFSGSDNSGTLQPVVIPPQETIPAAPDNTNGLQSVEISLGEQQLTDNVSFVGIVPFDIMFPVQGQYLDYVFDMRVERVQQRGVLYTCDCCVDVDQLLYTQIAYTVPPSTDWHGAGDSSTDTVTQDDKSVAASYHASSIARTIGKTPVIQFVDFSSTVLTENLGGATYADLIRDVFGWSSRVPTHMINVFIRNDKIYFVQRGHEARLIDLTGTKHTIPIVTHELVRMTWGSTPWSQTETREVEVYRPPTTSSSSSGTGSGTGDDSGSGSGSGTGTGSGDNPGTGTGTGDDSGSSSGSGDVTIEDPEDDGDDKKSAWSNVGQVVTEDSNGRTVTTYTYDKDGVLKKTVAEFTSKKDDKENNTKTTTNSYNSDGLIRQTSTTVRYPNDITSNSRVVTTYGYLKLSDGKKFLSTEMVSEYDANDKLVDQRVTTKSPTGRGQGTSDDDAGGSSGSGNIGDDRVTLYQRAQASKTGEAAFEKALNSYDSTWDKTLADYTSKFEHSTPTPAQVQELKEKFQKSFNDAFSSNHEANYYTERQTRTLNGLSLYDSSFPIHSVGKLMELTEAIRWLNRRTKETVTMTIYGYPHLIDFNDRILFNGAQYFLVSNVAMTNARVFNEQRVTFTRWY